MVDCLKSVLHGFLIGIANIIPGVSGGSMALALGIYERLIAAIGQFGPATVKATLGVQRFKLGAADAVVNRDNAGTAMLGADDALAMLGPKSQGGP